MENDDILDSAFKLLSECRFRKTRTYEKAVEAIELLEKLGPQKDSAHTMARGLVEYPDLLKRYVNIFPLDTEDIKSMICRCIEHSLSKESLDFLLNYTKGESFPILLLPGKYKIDQEAYELCKSHGISDPYYDGKEIPYSYSLNALEFSLYFGYRNCYHALIYKANCEALLENWDTAFVDCSTEAALDFFSIPYDKETYQEKFSELRPILVEKMKNHGVLKMK